RSTRVDSLHRPQSLFADSLAHCSWPHSAVTRKRRAIPGNASPLAPKSARPDMMGRDVVLRAESSTLLRWTMSRRSLPLNYRRKMKVVAEDFLLAHGSMPRAQPSSISSSDAISTLLSVYPSSLMCKSHRRDCPAPGNQADSGHFALLYLPNLYRGKAS